MNNQELELRVKAILQIPNFFDMMIEAKNFEKAYKTSDFYAATKMPLMEVIKGAKAWYAMQFEDILVGAQRLVDSLSLDNINEIIDQIGNIFTKENEEILSMGKNLSELLK